MGKTCRILYSGKVVARKSKYCDTFFSRMRGLMFQLTPKDGAVLVAPSVGRAGASIHMLFVFFPLQIIWLDKDKKIVDFKRISPFSIHHSPKYPAKFVVELPVGIVHSLKVGKTLEIVPISI